MANWKEKGVVPDSEDEDTWDSQDTTADDFNEEQQPLNSLDGPENGRQDNGQAESHGEGAKPPTGLGSARNHSILEGDISDEVGVTIAIPPADTPSTPRRIPLDSPLSSPESQVTPKAFKHFEETDDIQAEAVENEKEVTGGLQKVPGDEISNSYVRLSSPTPSFPSLTTDSPGLPLESASVSKNDELPMQRTLSPTLPPNTNLRDIHETPGANFPPKRSFRQRNPIQLHPYVVEQEKYRQTLKSRGLAPTRIAHSSQEEPRPRSRDAASPDQEFKEVDSQELDSQEIAPENGESQSQDLEWNVLPSSPPMIVDDGTDGHGWKEDPMAIDGEEEFLDIDELLKQRNNAPQATNPASKQSASSRKQAKPVLSKTPKASHRSLGLTASNKRIMGRQASPLVASPLLPSANFHRRGSMSRAISDSSRTSDGSKLAQDKTIWSSANKSLTPATSAIKIVSKPILLDTDSEDDDSIATGQGRSDADSSSSDESVLIRRVGKRFRGVLPASHLRLEQNKRIPRPRSPRGSMSLSPIRTQVRKGVAIPRIPRAGQSPLPIDNHLGFLSSDSGDDEEVMELTTNEDNHLELENLFNENRDGFAEEDDSIDAMLPPHKRRAVSFNKGPHKKRRVTSTLSMDGGNTRRRQSRITDHLDGPSNARPRENTKRARAKKSEKRRHQSPSYHPRTPEPPRLSILDITDAHNGHRRELPQFLRIAARTSRRRAGLGKQSPTTKFIRLGNREDTQDAHNTLDDWKCGRIKSTVLDRIVSQPLSALLHEPTHNGGIQLPRKIAISRDKQISLNDFVTKGKPPARQKTLLLPRSHSERRTARKRHAQPQNLAPLARPAQLESSEVTYSRRYANATFKTGKRALDALYSRTARAQSVQQRNVPLSRFLAAAADDVLPSIETVSHNVEAKFQAGSAHLLKERNAWRKTKAPIRIDTDAATYRQPSNPPIIDFFHPTQSENNNSKLLGLGKFGTNYTIHFNISPLIPGTHFHESTFIGSGRLAAATRLSQTAITGPAGHFISVSLDDKSFRWGSWDQYVSAQIGICFDWLADQLTAQSPSSPMFIDGSPFQLMISISDYLQDHLSFKVDSDADEFLSRMIEVMEDFSGRFESESFDTKSPQLRRSIRVFPVCTSSLLQLLHIARNRPDSSNLIHQLEELLKKMAGQCTHFLLADGFENIRTLYEDLQYLTFREAGINDEHATVEAWVIIMKVLDAAHIEGGSFWDVVNPHLTPAPIKEISDAPTLEKIWYQIYSLLPFTEFDAHGIVTLKNRQKGTLDNWSIPQEIIGRLFKMYEQNARQSVGFTNYLKTTINRCHYLMLEWGWQKGSSLLRILCDGFAFQNFCHLRNEEVYTSPRFLGELDTDPSLAVDRDDPCFHVFLKILAIQIQNFRAAGDINSIRNLVARLLPNHNRQYLKDEDMSWRDVGSLGNQHDLLSTLYWAAPKEQRPPLSLLQDFVAADQSHREACLINLRAWQNLSRFVVSRPENGTSYEPFRVWHSTMVRVLIQSYQRTEQDVRQRAETLSGITESRIQATTEGNKIRTALQIVNCIQAWLPIMGLVHSAELLLEVTDFDILRRLLDLHIRDQSNITEPIFQVCHTTCVSYMKQVAKLYPSTLLSSMEETRNLQAVLIKPLAKSLLPNLRSILRKRLEMDIDDTKDLVSTEDMVHSWACLVQYLVEIKQTPLSDFLLHGANAVFEHRRSHKLANCYWAYFLSSLLGVRSLNEFKCQGFDIGKEWLLMLVQSRPADPSRESLNFTSCLSEELKKRGHYFLTDVDLSKSSPASLVKTAICEMKAIMLRNNTQAEIGMTHEMTRRLFADTLEQMMKLSQEQLEAMTPNSLMHSQYLEQVQGMIRDIRTYANDLRPLTEFFMRSSSFYWPDQCDPRLIGAGLRSYYVRLRGNPKSTPSELFWYIFNDWKHAMISETLAQHRNAIKSAMREQQFLDYMFCEFLPAVLFVGAGIKGSWILCTTYLPLASNIILTLANRNEQSDKLFEYTANLLKLVLKVLADVSWNYETGIPGVHIKHRGIITVLLSFYFSIDRFVKDYAANGYLIGSTRSLEQEARIKELQKTLIQIEKFIADIWTYFTSPNPEYWPTEPEDVEWISVNMGDFGADFAKMLKEDMKTSLVFRDDDVRRPDPGFDVVVVAKGKESAVQRNDELFKVLDRRFLPDPRVENRFFGFFPTKGYVF